MNENNNMAMPWEKISNTSITENYNNGRIVRKHHLAMLLKTYVDNEDKIIIIMDRKKKNPSQPPEWFATWNNEKFEPRIQQIESRLDKIETRLDNIVKLNNLKE